MELVWVLQPQRRDLELRRFPTDNTFAKRIKNIDCCSLQIVPNGASARCAQIWVGDILLTIDGRHVTSIAEAKQLILGDEGTFLSLGLHRPSIGDFTLRIARGVVSAPTSSPSSPNGTRGPTAGDYGSWSVKELKQALTEAGINHSWANEKTDLVVLASENKIPPPGTQRSSSGQRNSGPGLS